MAIRKHNASKKQGKQKPRPAEASRKRNFPVIARYDPAVILRRAQDDPWSASPKEILQLQRTIGNRAVTRLFSEAARRRPQPPVSVTGAGPKTIQRRVGFEFEDGNWESYVNIGKEKPESEAPEKPLPVIIPPEFRKPWMQDYAEFIPDILPLLEKLIQQSPKDEKDLFLKALEIVYSDKNFLTIINHYITVEKKIYEKYGTGHMVDLKSPTRLFQEVADLMAKLVEVRPQIPVFKDWEKRSGLNDQNNVVKKYGKMVAPKKKPLHKDPYYTIEPDGPYNFGIMDIEFVTKPFEENDQGLKELALALESIEKIVNRLKPYAGKSSFEGNFVKPEEHGFSNTSVYLAEGEPEPAFKMQATQGVELHSIPALMEYFGTTVPYESSQQEKERQYARVLMRGSAEKSDAFSRIMGRSPALAGLVINILKQNNLFKPQEDTSSLHGFVAYLLMYIQSLSLTNIDGIKTGLAFMSRYSFSDLFAKLPLEQQKLLKSTDGRNLLLKAVSMVLPSQPFAEKPEELKPPFDLNASLMNIPQKIIAQKLQKDQKFFMMIRSLSVKDWINGILDGVDYLTKSGFSQYLHKNSIDHGEYMHAIEIFLRGHADSQNVLKDQVNNLAVMENRAIMPNKGDFSDKGLNMAETREAALSYLYFMKQVKEAAGDKNKVGPYPGLKEVGKKKK